LASFIYSRIHYFFRSSRQFWWPDGHIDIQKTASMKPHSVFLRTGCLLPGRIDLRQEQFCEKWMSVEDTTASALDVKIRNAGWHFMWLQDAYSHFATGRTAESAISKAIYLALHQVKGRFNAAELYSINVRKYPGFQVAKVTLYARQIQQEVSLGLVDEMTIRQLAAR
jgi:hypothetical protein